MSTQMISCSEIIERLPPGSTLILRGISWTEYEELLDAVGEARGLRLSYDQGTLQIITPSSEHENYSRLIERMVDRLSAYLRIKILFFGSSTIKKKSQGKGTEPDGCFYVQSATLIGNKIHLDFSSDPPPDIVVEVDLTHESLVKFPIHAAFGVPEIWRYDGEALTIHHLQHAQYVPTQASHALPMLTSDTLTQFLTRSQQEDQYETLLAFEKWLQAHCPRSS